MVPQFTDDDIKKMQLAILEMAGKIVKRKAIRLAPIDLGQLRASIQYQIVDDTVFIYSNLPYSKDMEFGKPPEPLSDTEKEKLKDWADRHGLPAGPVIRKIEREGIKVGTIKQPMEVPNGTYRPFLRPAVFQSLPEIYANVQEMFK